MDNNHNNSNSNHHQNNNIFTSQWNYPQNHHHQQEQYSFNYSSNEPLQEPVPFEGKKEYIILLVVLCY
jgi:hypothetical protein